MKSREELKEKRRSKFNKGKKNREELEIKDSKKLKKPSKYYDYN